MPAGVGFGGFGPQLFYSGQSTESPMPRSGGCPGPTFRVGSRPPDPRLVAATCSPIIMSTENLDRLLTAANEFDASDLHLVAGVPPAFRVNGEIIIADEDAL